MSQISALHDAINKGELEEVRRLVEGGACVNQLHGMKGTALCAAIAASEQSIAEYLIDVGCDVNALDYDGEPPLILALRKECFSVVKSLIDESKCDVNNVDPVTKKSALCIAAENGNFDVVNWLVTVGADMSLKDNVQNTALHISVLKKHYDIMKFLVENGSPVKCFNQAGSTSVHIAAETGDKKAIEIIVAGLEARDQKKGHQQGDDGQTETLINLNAEQLISRDSPLHLAARVNHTDVVEFLISKNANVNVKNNILQSPLLSACETQACLFEKKMGVVVALLKAGADIDIKATLRSISPIRDTEVTPLMLAAMFDNLPLARLATEHKANLSILDNRGRSPIFLALQCNAISVAWHLINENCLETIDPKKRDHCGSNLLHAVAKCESDGFRLAQALIKHGCPVNVKNNLGSSPIHEAIAHENLEVTEALAQGGACMLAQDSGGLTPLHVCASTGNITIALALLTSGANINGKDASGMTPFCVALESDFTDFAKFLISAGADLALEYYLFEDVDEDMEDVPQILFDDEQLFSWFKMRARTPSKLWMLSLSNIRKYFYKNNIPFMKIAQLPLADKFVQMLMYRYCL